MGREIYCHICKRPLRDCGTWSDKKFHFVCDTDWCPTDEFKIEIITKPTLQEDGSYLSVL